MIAVILCAGRGRRFNLKTPKCLLKIKDETLIEKCLKNFQKNEIKKRNIVLATGYKENLIKARIGHKYRFIKNKKYSTTNMVYTFFNTIKNFDNNQDIIISYSDILYNYKDLKNLIKSKKDITTLIDFNWKKTWKKKGKLLEDSETLKIKNQKIVSIGKKTRNIKDIDGRFIGITKFSSNIIKKLQNIYQSHLKKNPGKFKKMDMTNFFNFLIKKNFAIFFTKSNKQWYEFDDKGDLDSFLVK